MPMRIHGARKMRYCIISCCYEGWRGGGEVLGIRWATPSHIRTNAAF